MQKEHAKPVVVGKFEESPGRARLWGGIFLAGWLLMFLLDWGSRFFYFRWQDTWLAKPPPATAASDSAKEYVFPDATGGDLSRMLSIAGLMGKYTERHPGFIRYRDQYGYPNKDAGAQRKYDVVFVGDSFMISEGMQTIAEVFAGLSGRTTYNHSQQAAGPALSMARFFMQSPLAEMPSVVVWGITARDLDGPLFARQPIKRWFLGKSAPSHAVQGFTRNTRWNMLEPRQLEKSWPNTSLLAYGAREAWKYIRFYAFGLWPYDVIGLDDPQAGPMLFYRENLRALAPKSPERDAEAVCRVVRGISKEFANHGVALVVLLVPEKEQIYRTTVENSGQASLEGSVLLNHEVARTLSAEGIPVVDLIPVFDKATAAGTRLYWRDDTHWNDAGIRLAAEEVWRTIEPLFPASP